LFNPALDPTPITPVSFRRFPVGGSPRLVAANRSKDGQLVASQLKKNNSSTFVPWLTSQPQRGKR
jgi:hypothetical protein